MKLYFENSRDERRLIGEPETEMEVWKMIQDFCVERNFKIPYTRTWVTPEGEKYYDCGSWTEFFVVIE